MAGEALNPVLKVTAPLGAYCEMYRASSVEPVNRCMLANKRWLLTDSGCAWGNKAWIGKRKYRIGKDCNVYRLLLCRMLFQIHRRGSRWFTEEIVFAKRIGDSCAVRNTQGGKGQWHKTSVAHYKNGMYVFRNTRKEYRSSVVEGCLQLSFKCLFLQRIGR